MTTNVQFTGSLTPNQTKKFFTHSWDPTKHVIWYVVPVTPKSGGPEIEWSVAVERTGSTTCTYWITVKNLTNINLDVEGRYAILN